MQENISGENANSNDNYNEKVIHFILAIRPLHKEKKTFISIGRKLRCPFSIEEFFCNYLKEKCINFFCTHPEIKRSLNAHLLDLAPMRFALSAVHRLSLRSGALFCLTKSSASDVGNPDGNQHLYFLMAEQKKVQVVGTITGSSCPKIQTSDQ